MKKFGINLYWITILVLFANSAFSQTKEYQSPSKEKCSNPNEVAVFVYPEKENIDKKNKTDWKCLALFKNKWIIKQETAILSNI